MAQDKDRLAGLLAELENLRPQLEEAIREVASTRRQYFGGDSSGEAKQRLEEAERKATSLVRQHGKIIEQMQEAAGLPDELIEFIEAERQAGDKETRIARKDLTREEVHPTHDYEQLTEALEAIYKKVDLKWLENEKRKSWRLDRAFLESPLSLFKGARLESECPPIHRFAQAILVSEDFLNAHSGYDFFAGSLLVPQTIALGTSFDLLSKIDGDVRRRISTLWNLPGSHTDSTVFELLVAAACTERGRKLEFLTTGQQKTPDLRVHDYPFPTVIECKRQRSLSEYEVVEEGHLRSIFTALREAAARIGMWGIFALTLEVEASEAPIQEIIDCTLRQRFSCVPHTPTRYDWGSVSYRELPRRLSLPNIKVYSPSFLEGVFRWNTDLPQQDGMICKVKSPDSILVDFVEEPVALTWTNTSPTSVKKRSWTVTGLLGSAMGQVPPGEVGIIYLCYQEGGREEIADLRMDQLSAQMKSWEHSAGIRVPVFFAVRLYPRPLDDGTPDLIESGVRFLSTYGDPFYFEDFPTTVFTRGI